MTNDARQPRASNIGPNLFVERSETNSPRARARSVADVPSETEPQNRVMRSGKLKIERDGELTGEFAEAHAVNFAETRKEAGSSSRAFTQFGADRPAVSPNRASTLTERGPALDHEARQSRTRSAGANSSRPSERASTANASVVTPRRAPSALGNKPVDPDTRHVAQARDRFASVDLAAPALRESREDMWPTLPPARNFEIADELAAIEREAETLRRLDREQKGISWNA